MTNRMGQVDEDGNGAMDILGDSIADLSGWSPQSLFPRLVLGWINADFRVQIRIFQHFSKSTRVCKILRISYKFRTFL